MRTTFFMHNILQNLDKQEKNGDQCSIVAGHDYDHHTGLGTPIAKGIFTGRAPPRNGMNLSMVYLHELHMTRAVGVVVNCESINCQNIGNLKKTDIMMTDELSFSL